jgi:4-carboxymuconolactone decarboxylase
MSLRRPTKARIEPVPEEVVRAEQGSVGIHIRATLAHNPMVAEPFFALLRTLIIDATTPRRQRELVVLRTGWNCQSEYEFAQHRIGGLEAGLSEAEIDAVTRPLVTHDWSEEDLVLLRMADDLCADFCVTDDVWTDLTSRWSTPDIMEFVFAAVAYMGVSSVLNSFGVQVEAGRRGWPSP